MLRLPQSSCAFTSKRGLRKGSKVQEPPDFILILGALSTSLYKVTDSVFFFFFFQTEASVQSISSHKNPQNLCSICTAGSKMLSNKLEASSKRAKEQKKHNLKMTQKESRGNEEYYTKFNYCRSKMS